MKFQIQRPPPSRAKTKLKQNSAFGASVRQVTVFTAIVRLTMVFMVRVSEDVVCSARARTASGCRAYLRRITVCMGTAFQDAASKERARRFLASAARVRVAS